MKWDAVRAIVCKFARNYPPELRLKSELRRFIQNLPPQLRLRPEMDLARRDMARITRYVCSRPHSPMSSI